MNTIAITFDQLWRKHPTITGDEYPCSKGGTSKFTNQCAIRMGTCLAGCGVDTTKIPQVRHCWFSDDKGKRHIGHTLAAEELANGLNNFSIAGVQKVQKINAEDFPKTLHGQTGIFFKDYWQRFFNGKLEEPRDRSGDHIDLWNKSTLTNPIYLNVNLKKLQESKEIWFWRVL